jgi:hypothetical protein
LPITERRSAAGMSIDAVGEGSEQCRFLSRSPGSSNAVLGADAPDASHRTLAVITAATSRSHWSVEIRGPGSSVFIMLTTTV